MDEFLELKRLTDELLDRLLDYFEPAEVADLLRTLADGLDGGSTH